MAKIDMIKVWTVSWDDTLGEVEQRGRFKGKVKRRSKDFVGRGAKGRATAKFNELKNYNPKLKERDSFVF